MKKKYVVATLVAMVLTSLVWYGCSKDKDSDLTGVIYGTVTDFATGQPISNANVKLRQTGETTLTGSDGTYEFQNVPSGSYSINVSKAEYTDLIDDYVIVVSDGKKVRLSQGYDEVCREYNRRRQLVREEYRANGQLVNRTDNGRAIVTVSNGFAASPLSILSEYFETTLSNKNSSCSSSSL